MNAVTIIMLIFSVLGGIDRFFGNKLKLGEEFEKGFMLLGVMALSMIGMIVVSPFLAELLSPFFDVFYTVFRIDPSVIPASLFANDMGGAALSESIAKSEALGGFNGLVVSSMMGCTISFTIPVALTVVERTHHKDMLTGFLCGIVTIPFGCFIAGLFCEIPVLSLLFNLLPLFLFAALVALGLCLCPNVCVKIFEWLGVLMRALITAGLVLGVIEYLTKWEIVPAFASLEEASMICVNASAVMSGAFPLLFLLGKLLTRPIRFASRKMQINETSALGFVSTLATSMTTFEMMGKMDKKGTVYNAAFLISAAFTFAGHLAFTMAFDAAFIFPVIIGKLTAGVLALLVAHFLYKRMSAKESVTPLQEVA